MARHSHSPTPGTPRDDNPVVYTDGACSGNPGPGGWAWAEVEGAWANGYEPETTNQRMELTAALRACEHFAGPLTIVSDSTYVVNCWRDKWWQGWLKRGWKNSKKEPVANRDLWEEIVPHFRDRSDLTLEWVKGHSGDEWNDIVDRLAVGAIERRSDARGDQPPTEAELGSEDDVGPSASSVSGASSGPGPSGPSGGAGTSGASGASGESGTFGAPSAPAALVDPGAGRRSDTVRSRDGRVPDGFLVAVAGVGARDLAESAAGRRATDELTRVLTGLSEMHGDLVVLTGLKAGAEEVAASAAAFAGVDIAVVTPYPDATDGWPAARRAAFDDAARRAVAHVVLEKKRPGDLEGRRKALTRRDGWLRSVADVGIVLTDGHDAVGELALRSWTKALGDDLWRLDI